MPKPAIMAENPVMKEDLSMRTVGGITYGGNIPTSLMMSAGDAIGMQ